MKFDWGEFYIGVRQTFTVIIPIVICMLLIVLGAMWWSKQCLFVQITTVCVFVALFNGTLRAISRRMT